MKFNIRHLSLFLISSLPIFLISGPAMANPLIIPIATGGWYVAGVTFATIGAAYAYAKSLGGVPDYTVSEFATDVKEWWTGEKTELVTLEELGYGDTKEITDGSKYYYSPSDQSFNHAQLDLTKKELKSYKKSVTSVSNHANVEIGNKTTSPVINRELIPLEVKDFDRPIIKNELSDLSILQNNKKRMIETKKWDKMSPISQKTYNNQIKIKEDRIISQVQAKNYDVSVKSPPNVNLAAVPDMKLATVPKVNLAAVPDVKTDKNTAPIMNTKEYEIKQNEAKIINAPKVIDIKPTVNVSNANESKQTNKITLAEPKKIELADAKTVKVAEHKKGLWAEDTLPVEPSYIVPPFVGDVDTVIVDNKDVSVGNAGEVDAVEGTKVAQKKKKRKQKTVMSTRNVGENVLYGLEPSTYEFQLSAMSKTQYASGKFSIWSNRRIVIKTSGLPKRSFRLAPGSQLNYHVRNVQLSSVIGLNSSTISSNVHNIRFTVFEPFGASLLDDLHDAAVDAGHTNYLRGIYLMKLKFYGMDDDGKPTDSGVVKYFPMKLIQCDFNVTGGGTEYNFEAVPYNANTLEDNRAKITQPVNLKGATVGELLFKLQDQLNEQPKIKTNKEGYDLKIVGKPFKYGSTPGVADSEIEGYTHGYPIYQNYMKFQSPFSDILLTGGGPDSKLAIELFKSTMNHDAFSSSANKVSFELNEEGKLIKDELAAKGAGQVKFNDQYGTRIYTYNAGTPVLSIIQGIIDSSDYIMRQFKTDKTMNVDVNSYGEIPWYKIDYKWIDANKSETPNKFIVRPYWVDQYVALPNTDPSVKINVKEVAREYDYIYTGKNRDILNFDLQYNFAFYAATAAQEDKTPGNTGSSIAQSPVITKNYGKSEEQDKQIDKGLASIESKITDVDSRSETQGGELGSVSGYKTASIIKKQLSDPTADLINLDLDILGDPYYLAQEDFNPNVLPRSEVNAYELNDGSIDANNGQVYVKVNFKTPTDIDDETGLYAGLQGSGKYNSSFFGGFYRLIQVTSNFEEGRFTQTLNMVRLRHQELEQPKETGMTDGVAGGQAVAPAKSGEFNTNSKMEKATQTEANILDGLHYLDKVVLEIGDQKKIDAAKFQGSEQGKAIADSFDYASQGSGQSTSATQTSVTQIGNKTVKEETKITGNKREKKITEETIVGGEIVEERINEETAGIDKYGGLTKEEYYEGKTIVGMDQSTGLTYVDTSTSDAAIRGGNLVREECAAAGGTKRECNKKARQWKQSQGYGTTIKLGTITRSHLETDRENA